MKRSIVQHGSSTLTISLPYKWVKQNRLVKGDELSVTQSGRALILRISDVQSKHSKTLCFEQVFLKRSLLRLYTEGYDEVCLKFAQKAPMSKIMEQIQELTGFEIIEQDDNSCLIRDVAKADYEEFQPILKKLFTINLSYSEEIEAALKNNHVAGLGNSAIIETQTNRLANFLQRILNKLDFEDTSSLLAHNSIIDRLEMIGDALGEFAAFLKGADSSPPAAALNLFHEINGYFRALYLLYFHRSGRLEEIVPMRQSIYRKFSRLVLKCNGCGSFTYLKSLLDELHHIEILIK